MDKYISTMAEELKYSKDISNTAEITYNSLCNTTFAATIYSSSSFMAYYSMISLQQTYSG